VLLISLLWVQSRGQDLPDHFEVEVSPAVHVKNEKVKLDITPIRYSFDREGSGWRVTSEWERDNGWVIEKNAWAMIHQKNRLEGRYENGKLSGTQVTQEIFTYPPGSYGEEFPGGPIVYLDHLGTLSGSLSSGSVIEAVIQTRRTKDRSLTYSERRGPEHPPEYTWIETLYPDSKPQALKFQIPLPDPAWFESDLLKVSGTRSFRLEQDLTRLDRYLHDVQANLNAGQVALAEKQVEVITEEIAAFAREHERELPELRVTFKGLPSDQAMLRLQGLTQANQQWMRSRNIMNDALDQTEKSLEDLKGVLTGNVMKSIFKNYLNWSTSLPTDITAGLAEYSMSTALMDMPRSALGWMEAAETDSTILRDQFQRKQALEAMQEFYQKQRDAAQKETKRVVTELRRMQNSGLIALDNILQHQLSTCPWAGWRANPKRTAAEQTPIAP
jgi:hypothetical protein